MFLLFSVFIPFMCPSSFFFLYMASFHNHLFSRNLKGMHSVLTLLIITPKFYIEAFKYIFLVINAKNCYECLYVFGVLGNLVCI